MENEICAQIITISIKSTGEGEIHIYIFPSVSGELESGLVNNSFERKKSTKTNKKILQKNKKGQS